MNREIKFRGKSLDNGEWVYGDLLQIAGGCVIYHGSRTDSDDIDASSNVAVMMRMDEVSPVHPDTIGQFTGFYDRTGREIYEGDIVNWIIGMYGEGFVEEGCVEWVQQEGCYVVINKFETNDHRKIVQPLIRCLNKIKVVGNVYDNPELLKGGKND